MNMLKAAQEDDGVRPDKVADVKARIEAGEYEPKGKDIAASLLRQELDVWG
jgi:negative regulator of flagellin synthesis FlgM